MSSSDSGSPTSRRGSLTFGQPRDGDVAERAHGGLAVRHHPEDQYYHCLAYPCPKLTRWFYLPRNSHLCADCITKAEGR